MNFKLSHKIGSMSLGGLYVDRKCGGDFLSTPTFCQQLNNLALPGRELVSDQFRHLSIRTT